MATTDHSPMLQSLIRDGYFCPNFRLDAQSCTRALTAIRATRSFGPSLFLSEEEFDADPQYTGVNPRPGRNFYEAAQDVLAFAEKTPAIRECMTELLGSGYRSLHHKVVCGVPEEWIPEWLRARILGNAVNNLGPYIRPEFRDITYFYGIDYHQDIIDFRDRTADFVTVYVYLHDVGEHDAPLHLLRGSHRLGATVFPHQLRQNSPGSWFYSADERPEIVCDEIRLTGPAGTVAWWHAATLHGTQPDRGDRERLSLRLLFARSASAASCDLDRVNDAIGGELALSRTRVDLAGDGSAATRGNVINSAREHSD